MHLSGFKTAPYLMVKPDSDLENINPDFLENKYTVRLSGKFDNYFLQEFSQKFHNVINLDIGNQYGDGDNSFIYDLPNLEGLVISLYKDSEFILDCEKLQKLYSIHFYVWSKKHIVNIDGLNDSLEHLTISGFDEKDLTKLSGLTNLKSLSFKTAKIKSLKGIETLTNLKSISFGGVRSLTDISDIKTLQNLKYLEFDICWKLEDFSPISELKELEVLSLLDCKNLASIKFVEKMPKLEQLAFLGTTIVNDYDITPAKNIQQVFGFNNKYNVNYEEKAKEPARKSFSTFLK
ncbi:leucine-rich repeat protein [Flavobacterium sp. ZT3R18]|uniref:leucine-rich repeat protein n=1 Tax=Flavobacterium sp. ZT3R18 TaxID=2594429 RepID=UPI00117A9A96|nr:leucine-rich repeat protein [Flavobacterium sp. ZT3R18]TRX30285.1 leucine-rich repeat protein [Flavobacterium sp. ZT3R18]